YLFCMICVYCVLLFFFSSRRRHTRSKRDWSSDVCSSDLEEILATLDEDGVKALDYFFSGHRTMMFSEKVETPEDIKGLTLRVTRSEERRVGKESRSRWDTSPYTQSVT